MDNPAEIYSDYLIASFGLTTATGLSNCWTVWLIKNKKSFDLLKILKLESFMQPRTKRQRDVLEYITSFIEEKGYEPSYQQIARHFRIASKSAIAKHVKALENQGLLSRSRENGSFGLNILPKNSIVEAVCEIKWLEIPFPEHLEKWELEPLYLPKFLIDYASQDRLKAFRVQNDAMLDEHICEGDIVLIEKRGYARDGDIVVVFIENIRVVLKKYFRHGANVELRPANEAYHSIHSPADKISIQGVVRGLLRLGN